MTTLVSTLPTSVSSTQSQALCLTCASTLSPKSLVSNDVFLTACCARPICARCLSRNPRLRVYDPCLACLGGVSASGSSSTGLKVRGRKEEEGGRTGLEVRDVLEGDMFTIGDDEDEDDDETEVDSAGASLPDSMPEKEMMDKLPLPPPPPYASTSRSGSSSPPPSSSSPRIPPSDSYRAGSTPSIFASSSDPLKYYIQSGDTLSSVALRLGIDGRRLAKLNNLPPSTLSTTPHLLHTRRFLTLPKNARITANSSSHSPAAEEDPLLTEERERARKRELAEKRFAFVTKEVDWRVAKAYVALADEFGGDDVDASGETEFEAEGGGKSGGEKKTTVRGREGSTTESRAVDRYLDDEEWEARELRAGRKPRLPSFPIAARR